MVNGKNRIQISSIRQWIIKSITAIHQAKILNSDDGEDQLRIVLQIVEQYAHDFIETTLGDTGQDGRIDPWIIPQNKKDAAAIINRVVSEVQLIESQLADRNKTDNTGKRLSSHDYHGWRKRAISAMLVKLKHLRWLKHKLLAMRHMPTKTVDAEVPEGSTAALRGG